HARPDEVVFTSGGTEGDHLAMLGAAWARRADGQRIVISTVEHHAVHGAAEVLADQGWAVDHLPVVDAGFVNPADFMPTPGTVLVSIMLANNETGVLQPVADVARRAHQAGALVHCDA